MGEERWDVIIIGAGPAGLMTAIACASKSLQVLILDGRPRPGSKLLISGGGRCNVTNLKVTERDYQSGDPRTVRNVLRAFPAEKTVPFFHELGVPLVLEEQTKYFPKAQSARVVLDALLRQVRSLGVFLKCDRKITRLSFEQDCFRVEGEGFEDDARTVVLCTGGLSYPQTGSDGSGYGLAKALGHTIVRTSPALTPLLTDDPDWKKLAGITLPVRLCVAAGDQEYGASEGALLLTHTGFSGPAALDISGPWLRCPEKSKGLLADFFPRENAETLRTQWTRRAAEHPLMSWKRFLSQDLPERLVEILCAKLGKDPKTPAGQGPKIEREKFFAALRRFPLRVTGVSGYEKAEVTAGGVDLREVDAKTLESRKCPGLYFAGEILDVDGRIGGFNFQWAWSSGFVAGKALRKRLGLS